MKRIMRFACALVVAAASFSLTATAQKKVVDSKTNYAKEVLQPYVDSGQLSGAISVFYKDGVQETPFFAPRVSKKASKLFLPSNASIGCWHKGF